MRAHGFPLGLSALILSFVMVVTLAACGSAAVPTTAPTRAPQPSTSPATTPAPAAASVTTAWQSERPIKEPLKATASSTQTVTVGDLATQQVKVVIPPGTLVAGTVVTVTNIENAPPMKRKVGTPVGAPVSISAGDKPTRLSELMTVTLKFDPSKLPSGTRADDLWATYYDGKDWQPFRPASVDLAAGTLTFTTDHLTGFGLVMPDVEEQIAQAVHSKVVAEVVQKEVLKNNIDDYMEEAIDNLLLKSLGMKEAAVKTKVVQSLLKDDEWGDVAVGFSDKTFDSVKVAQATSILVGKAVAQNVGSIELEALVGGSNVKESLKRGEGVEWVKSVSETAAFVAEGRYRDAAEILGTKIAMEAPMVKAAVAAREVIQWRIDLWRNTGVEDALKIYRFGAEPGSILGIKEVLDPGDFNGVWRNIEAVSRQLNIEAIARENKQRLEDGRSPLTGAEADKIRAGVKTEIEKQFKERVKQDVEIEKQKANLDKLLKDPAMQRVINGECCFGRDKSMDYKVARLTHFQERVLNDTRGKFVSTLLMAQLANEWYGAPNAVQARENYAQLMKKELGIYPPWWTPPVVKAAGKWVLVKRTAQNVGIILRADPTPTVSGNTANVTYSNSSWSCSWPEPPQTFEPGQKWGGTLTVRDAGSKPYSRNARQEPTLRGEPHGEISIGMGVLHAEAYGTVPPAPGESSAQSFSWTIPQDALSIRVSCSTWTISSDGRYSRNDVKAEVSYTYELRK